MAKRLIESAATRRAATCFWCASLVMNLAAISWAASPPTTTKPPAKVAASRLIKTSVAWQKPAPNAVAQQERPSRSPQGTRDLHQTIDDLFSEDAVEPSIDPAPTPNETTTETPRQSTETLTEELPTPTRSATAPSTQDANAKKDNSADRTIYRVDPSRQLIAVPADKIKPGAIYLHYDERLGRQVWSFVQADRTFWKAFGPGTTQPIERFDFQLPADEIINELRQRDPRLAFDVTSTGARVFLRLNDKNEWQLVRHQSVSSITELESGRRWELQWNRYLPVIHTSGDRWQTTDAGPTPSVETEW